MALDFQNYLYSSSPPDFQLFTPPYLGKRRRSPPKISRKPVTSREDDGRLSASFHQLQLSDSEMHNNLHEDYALDEVGLTKCKDRRNDADRIRSWESSYNFESDTCAIKRNENEKRRNVTFADTAGLALSKVRVIHETSDEPPDLGSYLMQNGINSECINKLTVSQPASHLEVNFSQPAASYMSFREKVMTDCVSLENVIVRDNFKLAGTVKVKNIACSKAVTIRCTFDSWSSDQDVEAKPVSSEQARFGLFATFTFEVVVPSDVSTKHGAIQFAVCYVADGQEYWDNNKGQNYVIDVQSEVSQREGVYAFNARTKSGSSDTVDARVSQSNNTRRDSVYSFEPSTSWSEFAGWSDLVGESPYW